MWLNGLFLVFVEYKKTVKSTQHKLMYLINFKHSWIIIAHFHIWIMWQILNTLVDVTIIKAT